MKRKIFVGIGILLLVLIITNPGPAEFKSFLHQNRDNDPAGREANFFIFSIYSNVGDYPDAPRNGHIIKYTYIGILGNFFSTGSENIF